MFLQETEGANHKLKYFGISVDVTIENDKRSEVFFELTTFKT